MEDIEKLENRLKELKIKAMKLMSESGCVPCDLAVASSMIAQGYKDKSEGERKREEYLEGKITLGQLLKGMEKNEKTKEVLKFIYERFKYAMDLKFTDFEE